jgi:hypothetical protein
MTTVVITDAGELLYADLSQIGETQEFLLEQPSTPLGSDYAELTEAPTPTAGVPYVAMTADGETFAEVLGDRVLELEDGWRNFTEDSEAEFTRYFNNAYIARFETGYIDFGDANLKKNFLGLRTTWQRHSRAYMAVYAETEDGRRNEKWRGLVFNREEHLIPLNLCGRRIRVRLLVVLFNDAKALLRDISIGWQPAGTT